MIDRDRRKVLWLGEVPYARQLLHVASTVCYASQEEDHRLCTRFKGEYYLGRCFAAFIWPLPPQLVGYQGTEQSLCTCADTFFYCSRPF